MHCTWDCLWEGSGCIPLLDRVAAHKVLEIWVAIGLDRTGEASITKSKDIADGRWKKQGGRFSLAIYIPSPRLRGTAVAVR